MSVQQAIIDAIRSHVAIRVNYQGQIRDVCPHRIGWKAGKPYPKKRPIKPKDPSIYQNHINVFVYQFGGYSSHGLAPDGSPDNFRCWKLEDIYAVAVIPGGVWHTGRTFTMRESACIDNVIAGS